MDSRERVFRAIEMDGPDRVPVSHSTLPGAWRRHGDELRRLYCRYPSDVVLVGDTGAGEYAGAAGVRSTDAWGSVWVSSSDDNKGQVERPLITSWDDVASFRRPSPAVPAEALAAGRRAVSASPGRYVLADGDTLWQRLFYLRGFENLAVDLALEPARAAALRDLVLDFLLERIDTWSRLDVDGFQIRDDWGSQEALLISPALWRQFFKPAYRRIVEAAHSAGKHLWFHSDGYIRAIVPDMIEIGVDVLNPQPAAMGIAALGREFGGKVCFLGDIDRQWTLPFGAADDVRQRVREEIAAFGGFRGGYIAQGQIAADVPLGNAEAMLRAFDEYGRY
ncbi:MAG: uroporphyrinogen decarboxylase family protein [Anaerolineae bacterium]